MKYILELTSQLGMSSSDSTQDLHLKQIRFYFLKHYDRTQKSAHQSPPLRNQQKFPIEVLIIRLE